MFSWNNIDFGIDNKKISSFLRFVSFFHEIYCFLMKVQSVECFTFNRIESNNQQLLISNANVFQSNCATVATASANV